MLEGWYCRSLASEQAGQQDEATDPNQDDDTASEDSQDRADRANGNANVDYKAQYRYLKRKLKFLVYENEFFQEALRANQRRLLKVARDRAFLLDRLLQYEKPENTSSDSEETESSDDEATKEAKKRKLEGGAQPSGSGGSGGTRGRKRKVPTATVTESNDSTVEHQNTMESLDIESQQGHMSSAEMERHLQQPSMELMPTHASATVPAEMFSNEPSLDSESNDHIIDGSSPSHVAAEECVPMQYHSDM